MCSILDPGPLNRHMACECFLPHPGLSTLLLVSFEAQKCHILTKSHSSVFSFIACAFGVLSKLFLFVPRPHTHILELALGCSTLMLGTSNLAVSKFFQKLPCLEVIMSFGTDHTTLTECTLFIIVLLQILAAAASCMLCVTCTTVGTQSLTV